MKYVIIFEEIHVNYSVNGPVNVNGLGFIEILRIQKGHLNYSAKLYYICEIFEHFVKCYCRSVINLKVVLYCI